MPTQENGTGTGVIILGMHRSGTSLAAEIVHRWGAYIDTSQLIESNDGNPRGYWEHRPMVQLNDKLLARVHSSWKVPPSDEGEGRLAGLARQSSYRNRASRLLATLNPKQNVWLWKDPRLSILLPFWRELWGRVIYLVPVRDPMAIASSLCARGDFTMPATLLLWQRYMTTLLSNDEVSSNAFFFSYEELLNDTATACERLCRFLDVSTGREGHSHEHRLRNMLEAVQPQLNRNQPASSFSQSTDGTEVQRNLYRALMHRCQGLSEPSRDSFPMPAGWRDVLVKNAIAGKAGERFQQAKRLLRPAKWRAATFWRQIVSR